LTTSMCGNIDLSDLEVNSTHLAATLAWPAQNPTPQIHLSEKLT
jgi:hypothetical protein